MEMQSEENADRVYHVDIHILYYNKIVLGIIYANVRKSASLYNSFIIYRLISGRREKYLGQEAKFLRKSSAKGNWTMAIKIGSFLDLNWYFSNSESFYNYMCLVFN